MRERERDAELNDPPPLEKLAKGFRRRTLKTVRLASKLGFKALKKNMGIDKVVEQVDEDLAVEAATRLLQELDGLKGLVMKFGQMASYLNASLPPKAQRILARLQSQSQPMAYQAVAAVVQRELGESPDELFDEFEHEPFAAASLGQVHRARLDGDELAVKIQYPNIDQLLEGDLKTIGKFARLTTMLSALDGKELVAELRDRMLEECDYVREASNQELFRKLFEKFPGASVPKVLERRSSRRVLTSEYMPNLPFYSFCDEASQQLKDRAAEIIFDTCFKSIFRYCIYNADPHPGNYLFDEDGSVVFLDFGCIKRFDVDFINRWKRVALTLINDDQDNFRDAYIACGFVNKPKRFDFDHQWESMNHLYRPYKSKEPFTFTHTYVQESYDLWLWKNKNRNRIALPRDWLFVNRLQWGLNSVLAHLGATGLWSKLWRKAVESPTEPVEGISSP